MGTRSKGFRLDKEFKSAKNLKLWCKARGIDFKEHCEKYHIKIGS